MNNYITTDWVSMNALRLLLNKLVVSMYFNDDYNNEYQKPFSPGETIKIQYPPLYAIRNGIGYNPQAIQQIYTTITVDQIFGIDFQWDDVEAALKLERDDKRTNDFYMRSPMKKIAQEWDLRSALFGYQYTPNIVGVLGTNPTVFADFSASAEQILFEQAGIDGTEEVGECCQIISAGMNKSLVGAMQTTYNPQFGTRAEEFQRWRVGNVASFDTMRSMSLRRHTNGTVAGAFTVNGANQSGSSLTVNLTAGDTITKGTKIGIGSTTPTNPMTGQSIPGRTFVFTVTEDLTAAGGGADVLQISPPIYGPSSPFQNIDALPANAATLTVMPGTASPNAKAGYVGLALQRDAFFRVNVPLDLPKAVEIAKQHRDSETGFSIRFTRTWDAIQSRYVNRFDTLGGYGIGYNFNCAVALLGA